MCHAPARTTVSVLLTVRDTQDTTAMHVHGVSMCTATARMVIQLLNMARIYRRFAESRSFVAHGLTIPRVGLTILELKVA